MSDHLKKFLLSSLIILALFIGYTVAVKMWYPNMAFRGQFGDSFGGLNTLFSGLAFAGVIVSIYLQSKELKIQGEELKQTRIEFHEQNKIISSQLFENTFFKLLELLGKTIESLSQHNPGANREDTGYRTLPLFRKTLNEDLRNHVRQEQGGNNDIADMKKVFETWLKHNGMSINTYLNIVIQVIEFVEIKSDPAKSTQYFSIFKSLLTEYELVFLFYKIHYLSSDHLKALCKQQKVFSEFNLGLLIDPIHRPIANEYK